VTAKGINLGVFQDPLTHMVSHPSSNMQQQAADLSNTGLTDRLVFSDLNGKGFFSD